MALGRAFRQESPFWPFLVALGIQLVAFSGEVRDYHPVGDDVSLIIHATNYVGSGDVLRRLMQSFTGYFTVYPEWTSPFSNFFRPVAQLVYYLDYVLFQDYWGLYLLLDYLINALAVAIVYVLARLFLQSERITSYLVALVFFFTVVPSKAAYYPSFAFDPLAAVLAGSAFLAMAQSWIVAATLLMTVALFVKETVVVAPVALGASYLVLAWTHKEPGESIKPALRNAAAMTLFPLSLWLLARTTLCGGFGGTYVARHLDTIPGMVRKLLLGISVWPLGHDLAPVAAVLKRVVVSSESSAPGDAAILTFVVVNLLFAGFFVVAFVRGIVRDRGAALGPRAWAALCWVGAVGLLLVGLGLEKRFGYLAYLFGIPLLGRLMETARWRPVRLAAMAYLVVQVLAGGGNFAHILSDTAQADRHAAYARARDVEQLLKTVSRMASGRRTVYLVNDVVGDYAGPLLRRFATRDPQADLVVLTSRTVVTPQFVKKAGAIEITLHAKRPLVFPGVDADTMMPLVDDRGTGLAIRRNETLSYDFPEGRVHASLLGDIPRLEFGKTVSITVKDPRGIFVYYDAGARQHRIELPWTH